MKFRNLKAGGLQASLILCLGCSATEFGGTSDSRNKKSTGKSRDKISTEDSKDPRDGSVGQDDSGSQNGNGQLGSDGGDQGSIRDALGEGGSGGTDNLGEQRPPILDNLVDGATDPDGILVDGCVIPLKLPQSSIELSLKFEFKPESKPNFKQFIGAPVVAPLKRGATPTILAVGYATCSGSLHTPGHLFAIDGDSGKELWASSFQVPSWVSPAVGDVDVDGGMDIVIVDTEGYARILDANGKEKKKSAAKVWQSAGTHQGGKVAWPTSISVADLDNDGDAEIVIGGSVLFGKSLQQRFQVQALNDFSVVADVDGKKGLEIITRASVFSGKNGDKICDLPAKIHDPAVARLRAADKAATIVGVASNKIYGFNGRDCREEFSMAMPVSGGGPINLADFDGDKILDIGIAGRGSYMAFSGANQAQLWTSPTKDHSSERTGSTTFDFNGDGRNEIVYGDEVRLHIYDGSSGRTLWQGESSSHTGRELPAVADVDDDGHAEIVLATNTCLPQAHRHGVNYAHSGIRVFEEKEDRWIGTRTTWNQHAYVATHTTSGGRLIDIDASSIYKPWLSSEHLVGFRNNIPHKKIKKECVEDDTL